MSMITEPKQIAPYPQRVEDVTATSMIRSHLAIAQAQWHKWFDQLKEGATNRDEITLFLLQQQYQVSVAYLLREIRKYSPELADEAAVELWEWMESDTLGSWVYEMCQAEGLDPESIYFNIGSKKD